jgi:hypothetical protein
MDLNGIDLNAARDAAVAETEKKVGTGLGKAWALLGSHLTRASGGDPFVLETLVNNLVTGLENGEGFATSAPATTPVAALGAGAPAKPATPSQAEQLGEKLLALYGDNATQADTALTFLERANAGGSDLQQYLVVTTERVLKGADSIVTMGRQLMLLSHKNDKDLLDKAKDIAEEVLNCAIVDDIDKIELNDALKAVKDLKVKAAAPASPVPNTDLADFVKLLAPALKMPATTSTTIPDQTKLIDTAKEAMDKSAKLDRQVADALVIAGKNRVPVAANPMPNEIWIAVVSDQERRTTTATWGGDKRPKIIL